MAETGFSQDQIDSYTEIVMDPSDMQHKILKRYLEECGTFATYEVCAVDNTLLASTEGLSFTQGPYQRNGVLLLH